MAKDVDLDEPTGVASDSSSSASSSSSESSSESLSDSSDTDDNRCKEKERATERGHWPHKKRYVYKSDLPVH